MKTNENVNNNKVLRFFKTYKVELIIETIIIFSLICFKIIGILNFQNILSDGTFIIGILSIPIVIFQYIHSKKEDSNSFYNSTLSQILNLYDENIELNRNIIRVKILQLKNMYDLGKYRIQNNNDFKLLVDITKSVYFELITQELKSKLNDFKLGKLNNYNDYFTFIEFFEESDREWLTELNNNVKNIDYQKWFSKSIQKEIPELYWKTTKLFKNNIPNKGFSIYYKTNFKFDDINGSYLVNSLLIDTVFLFNSGKDKIKMIDELNQIDNELTLINPKYKINDNDIQDFNYLMLNSIKLHSIEILWDNDKSINYIKEELKKDYSNKQSIIKFSKHYEDKDNLNILKSWFSFSKYNYEKLSNIKIMNFVILNDNPQHNIPKATLLTFSKEEFDKLIEIKNKLNINSDRYDFYFWITFNNKNIVRIADTRQKNNNIKLNCLTSNIYDLNI